MRKWLEKEPVGAWQHFTTAHTVFSLDLAIVLLFGSIIAVFTGGPDDDNVNVLILEAFTERLLRDPLGTTYLLAKAALIEEIVFRGIPLHLAVLFSHGRWGFITPVALVSSFVFGWGHGGWEGIFLQGFGGLLYCGLFLKCGGLRGRILRPLAMCWAIHLTWNGMELGIAIAGSAITAALP